MSTKNNNNKNNKHLVVFKQKVLLKFSQNLPENNRVGVLSYNFTKNRLWLRCFSINFAKFLTSLFYKTPPVDAFETFYLPVVIMKYK